MEKLSSSLVEKVVAELPPAVRQLLQAHPAEIVVAGGMVRDLAVGEKWKDIDLFGQGAAPTELAGYVVGGRDLVTDYLIDGQQVQYIQVDKEVTKYIFGQFDFTCGAGMVWWDDLRGWVGKAAYGFNTSILRKRLEVCSSNIHPKIFNRITKHLASGWKIDPDMLAYIIAQLVDYTDEAFMHRVDKNQLQAQLTKLMQEGNPRVRAGLRGYQEREETEAAEPELVFNDGPRLEVPEYEQYVDPNYAMQVMAEAGEAR